MKRTCTKSTSERLPNNFEIIRQLQVHYKFNSSSKFSHDELLTALTEIVLNSRPLTCTSADDLEEPLTSSHLLVGS